MKRFLAAVLLVYLCALTTFAKDHSQPVLRSIIRVTFLDDTQREHVCTGFLVRPKQAITAAHCAPADTDIYVDNERAVVFNRNDKFVLVSAPDKPVLKLGAPVKLQQSVTSYGYAWGEMYTLQRNVSKVVDDGFATDGPLAPGMSGGPTVNQAGNVVGINHGTNTVIGLVFSAAEMRVFLASPLQK